MECTRPISCFKDLSDKNIKTGKGSMVFAPALVNQVEDLYIKCNRNNDILRALYGKEFYKVPCNHCPACRSNYARDWSIRAYHESKLHEHNVFLTLTYSDRYLPDIYNERSERSPKIDFVNFMKRFRMNLYRQIGDRVRFFHVFEYGSQFSRPHHHAIIYGTNLKDKKFWKLNDKFPVFRSPILEKSWTLPGELEPMGFCTVQNVDYNVCAYVSRYCLKKVDVDNSHYDGRIPEFNLKSRMPGLGHDYVLKNFSDIYNDDKVVIKDYVTRPPRYYDGLYDMENHEEMEVIKHARQNYASKHCSEDTAERLLQKEHYLKEKIKRTKRRFETEV